MTFLSDPINFIASFLRSTFTNWGFPEGLIEVLLALLGVVIIATIMLVIDILLVWAERKIVARLQDRLGPNRLGPYGIIQPFADIIKLLIKEDITPAGADRFVYNLAPIMALGTVILLWAVIPFGPRIFGSDLNVGILFVVAVGALGALSTIMAGWASNNKYALLGAFREVAKLISFEVPMVLALLVPVILARSMGINQIVQSQEIWYVVYSPLAALIFFITAQAELGRAPFDLAEAESEIVAGFHIEYTGMKFGMFYAGELLHALTFGALISALFLGGWRGPGAEAFPLLGVVYFFIKAIAMYFAIAWVKYSMPRVRIDQMLNFAWKFLTPLALVLVIVTAIMSKLLEGLSQNSPFLYALSFLVANVVLILITVQILRKIARKERIRVAEPRPIARAPEPTTSELS